MKTKKNTEKKKTQKEKKKIKERPGKICKILMYFIEFCSELDENFENEIGFVGISQIFSKVRQKNVEILSCFNFLAKCIEF